MNNYRLSAAVVYLSLIVLLPETVLAGDHGPSTQLRPGAARANANASATIVNSEVGGCDDLLRRTRASVYTWGNVDFQNRHRIDPYCRKAEGRDETMLVVEYRERNGTKVTVSLSDGSVLISPAPRAGRGGQSSADDVQIVDVLINYD